MHTLSNNLGFRLRHNSDWSGDAILVFPDGREVSVPGSVFVEIAAKIACARVEAWVQSELYDVIIGKER